MAQLWYDGEQIGEVDYDIHPSEGDIIATKYSGEVREFIVTKVRKYYPISGKAVSRIELTAFGAWVFA